MRRKALVAGLAGALVAAVLGTVGTGAAAAPLLFHRPVIALGANQSGNWSGYNQGTVEQVNKQFHSISGSWRVPVATQHVAGEAEYSSAWIGIGGGCVDANCQVTDSTLIQTGTEMDVDSTGAATYSAWWEIIPEPETVITTLTIHPGDLMYASITEDSTSSENWKILLVDRTTHKKFTTTTPYPSSYATAEWITETPVVVDNNGNVTIGPLPTLSMVHFDHAKTNGANAGLISSEELQLSSGSQLATPSDPDPTTDGFNDCVYQNSCPTPTHG